MLRPSRDTAYGIAAGLLFAGSCFALYGYEFGTSTNHAFYLPWVFSFLEPDLYAGDPAVAGAAGVPTFFWHAFALLAGVGGVNGTASVLWVFSRIVGGWATFRAAKALGAQTPGAFLAVAFTGLSSHLFVNSLLAGDPLFKGFLDQTSFSWPLLLFIICFWLEDRRRAAFPLLGLLANLNPLIAGLTASWLLLAERFEKGITAREIARRGGFFLLTACPVLIRMIANGTLSSPEIMITCTPNTYLAQVWPWERFATACSFLILYGTVFYSSRRATLLLSLFGSGLALIGAGVIAGLVPALHPLAMLQFFRLDVLLSWIGVVAAATLLESYLGNKDASFMAGLAACLPFACIVSAPPPRVVGSPSPSKEGRFRRESDRYGLRLCLSFHSPGDARHFLSAAVTGPDHHLPGNRRSGFLVRPGKIFCAAAHNCRNGRSAVRLVAADLDRNGTLVFNRQ